MKEDETIDTFTAKLTTLANKAAGLGHTFDDSTLVRKLLNAVPDRTDRGGEIEIRAEFTQYCKENGIARQLTAPYSPQQNGVVERRNRTIMSTTRCMMKATEMPQSCWLKLFRPANIHSKQRFPTKAQEDITPYKLLKERIQT
ncbi:zinc finger, CCHC-type containing protein [Tanacetum coccineum]|uniref:Zinc finger, CCHC-type containing protein n=1 Tax=Tanacetum coccineum TaxID=301880 RepID=A0ABQ5AFH0_9ASTR